MPAGSQSVVSAVLVKLLLTCRQRTGNEVSLWSSEGAPRSRETAIADSACAAGSVVQLTSVSYCMRLVLCCELLLHLPPVFDRVWFSKPPVVVKEA